MNAASRRALTAVARGQAPADLYLRGGTLLNVYTGELYPAHVATRGERIAYVGLREEMVGPRTRVLDVSGRILVPGYIDPHVHPTHLVTLSAFARHLLPLGTTTVVADGDRVAFELALPIGGVMGRGTLAARGYPFHDPLFTLFFMAADFLPSVRLTPRGMWDVKRSRVLLPSRRR